MCQILNYLFSYLIYLGILKEKYYFEYEPVYYLNLHGKVVDCNSGYYFKILPKITITSSDKEEAELLFHNEMKKKYPNVPYYYYELPKVFSKYYKVCI